MHLLLPLPAALAALLGMTCTLATTSSAQVQVEEQVLVANAATAGLTLSPRGVRVAAVIAKGSRQAVVYDGVEGPRFDQVMTFGEYRFSGQGGRAELRTYVTPGAMGVLQAGLAPGGNRQVLFSDDGQHWAYVGRSGDELALMLDGQESHRGRYQQFSWMAFSPQGAHLVATAMSAETGLAAIVIDGKAGPWGADIGSLCFTADDQHYAYTGHENDAQQTPWMVVDGRQVKHAGEIVGFASTGTLFTRRTAGYNQELLANGKPLAQAQSFDYLALDGTRLVLAVTPPSGTPPQPKPRVLTVDGQVIAGTEDVNVSGAWFSPDGKRYAVLCQRYAPRMESFMIVDGKRELGYQSIYTTDPYKPSFSPDSSKFCYVAMSPVGIFIVVNGEESDGLQMIGTNPVWSPSGSRLAWGGTTPAQEQLLVIDGQRVPLLRNAQPGPTFQFSPDGAHTFWNIGGPNALSLIVDGAELPGVAGLGFVGAEAIDGQYAALRFSPDGQHVAYPAREAQSNSHGGMWVDGKLITPATRPQMNRVTFTPDSQHVAWAMGGTKDNVGVYQIFVDGREAVTCANSALDNLPGAWEMGADGVLTILGIDGGALKRYRITPAADSSITSMLAAAN